MANILLKSVLLKGGKRDILIKGNEFAKIGERLSADDSPNAEVVDCENFAIVPAFYNGHCHAAMTLLRGYADDMPLMKWLQEYIWPFEAKMQPRDIEIGTRLAILEMIKSGTVFFSDMYWHREQTIKVVEEMGIRATIGVTIAENIDTPESIEENFRFLSVGHGSERVKIAPMPHAIYTVGEKLFRRCADAARSEGMILHTHLSETQTEVADCQKNYGCTPVELLDRWGVLGSNFVGAHCVHLSDNDMALMAKSGSTAILNLCSNLKLGSGIPQITKMMESGIRLGLGTDGASSNNNLDMHEEMKLASLLAKADGRAEALTADEAVGMATANVAQAYGFKAGVIAEGYLADALLVDLKNERLVPNHNFISNWVYAADSSSVDSVICNGRFVMRGRHIDGEEEIMLEAEKCAKRLAGKS